MLRKQPNIEVIRLTLHVLVIKVGRLINHLYSVKKVHKVMANPPFDTFSEPHTFDNFFEDIAPMNYEINTKINS